MIRLKNLLNELNISKDDMEKLHNDGEVEVDGQKITFKSETEVNEVSDSEIKKSIKKNERGGPYTIMVRHGNMSKKVVDHSPKSYDKVEDAIKMYHKYNKKHKGRGVSIEDGYGRTVFIQESLNEQPVAIHNRTSNGNIVTTLKESDLNEEEMKLYEFGKKVSRLMEKNVPTNPSKWAYYKAQAKKKFDVYPSAYANGWAAKQYKAAGGGWKKGK